MSCFKNICPLFEPDEAASLCCFLQAGVPHPNDTLQEEEAPLALTLAGFPCGPRPRGRGDNWQLTFSITLPYFLHATYGLLSLLQSTMVSFAVWMALAC